MGGVRVQFARTRIQGFHVTCFGRLLCFDLHDKDLVYLDLLVGQLIIFESGIKGHLGLKFSVEQFGSLLIMENGFTRPSKIRSSSLHSSVIFHFDFLAHTSSQVASEM